MIRRLIAYVLRLLWWPQLARPALLGWPIEDPKPTPASASIAPEPQAGGACMDGHELSVMAELNAAIAFLWPRNADLRDTRVMQYAALGWVGLYLWSIV